MELPQSRNCGRTSMDEKIRIMNNKLHNAMGAAKPGEMVDPPLLTLQFDGIRIPKLEETAFRLSSRTSLIETARVD